MVQQPTVDQLIPLVADPDTELKHHWDYLYEPDAKQLLEGLLVRYVESQVYQAVIENNACEQASRMLAMKNATENAGELIGELQLIYNKARQAAITQEISEIVGGAAAL
jgi:F-type H+-transporting ATPase subunit gamma